MLSWHDGATQTKMCIITCRPLARRWLWVWWKMKPSNLWSILFLSTDRRIACSWLAVLFSFLVYVIKVMLNVLFSLFLILPLRMLFEQNASLSKCRLSMRTLPWVSSSAVARNLFGNLFFCMSAPLHACSFDAISLPHYYILNCTSKLQLQQTSDESHLPTRKPGRIEQLYAPSELAILEFKRFFGCMSNILH